jgi:hypothetical protein
MQTDGLAGRWCADWQADWQTARLADWRTGGLADWNWNTLIQKLIFYRDSEKRQNRHRNIEKNKERSKVTYTYKQIAYTYKQIAITTLELWQHGQKGDSERHRNIEKRKADGHTYIHRQAN